MRIAVCDDNREMLMILKSTLNTLFGQYTADFQIVCFISGKALLEAHNKNNFDIVFLDIDMPDVTGFDVAKAIRDEFSKCYIIFITSHSELVYDSFDFQPFDFIRKNSKDSMVKSLNHVVKKLMFHSKQNETFAFEDEFSRSHIVPIRNIIYLESEKHYINFYVSSQDTPFRMRATIKDCEDKFEKYDFIRIHKSYIVNLRYVEFIDKSNDEVALKTVNKKLPMSRNLKKEVTEKHILYLRNLL